MDPLSIVASVVAISQATERLAGLLSGITIFLSASKDIPLLIAEVAFIKRALERLLSVARMPEEQLDTLVQPICLCLCQISELEAIISMSSTTIETPEERTVEKVNRLIWARKNRKVVSIKVRLKEGISAIQFELLSLHLAGQLKLARSVNDLTRVTEKLQDSFNFHFQISQRPLEDIFKQASRVDMKFKRDNNLVNDESMIVSNAENEPALKSLSTAGQVFNDICLCPCDCHRKKVLKTTRIFHALPGIILIEWIGNPLSRTPCNRVECIKRSNPYLSITYFGRWWSSKTAFTVACRTHSSPFITLSFPRFLRPDAEVFTSIRLGQVDRVKALLIEGRASVADVLLPYGLSTLEMATLYGQTEICKLLISAGANRVTPLAQGSLGNELWMFWGRFYTHDYMIPPRHMLNDCIRQVSCMSYAKTIAAMDTESSHENQSYTRLHKSILGLTLESVSTVLHSSSDEIDDVDSLGRTALHLAAYRCDSSTLQLLLRQKANPDITDQTKKTPLHIAASIGSVACTSALIKGGANMNAIDPFGFTPFHHACMSGQEDTARLLHDAGANRGALTSLWETPPRHCVFSDQVSIMQMFYDVGETFEEQDRIGGAAIHDAIWFNSHQALRFLLGIRVRLDQRLSTGKTVLHVLAENADIQTMETFGEMCYPKFGNVNFACLDKTGFSAENYLSMRKDTEKTLAKAFQLLMERVEDSLNLDSPDATVELEEETEENFFNAVEVQPDDD